MPTYGYKCDKCGHELEAFQRMSDDPLRECPACGADTLRRQVFPIGVVFKGSGFYKTDYAAKGAGANGSPEKAGDKSPEKAAEKAADGGSKPETGSSDKPAAKSD